MTDIKGISDALSAIREKKPLIHCITNHISIGDCANMLLALGARPIMAEHSGEVADITCSSKALALNLGNISESRMSSMMIASRVASGRYIPSSVDVVGVAASRLRLDYALKLIRGTSPKVIRGNSAELRALVGEAYTSSGVDSLDERSPEQDAKTAVTVARRYSAVAVISGATDVITDGKTTYFVSNGDPMMTRITGTGCMFNAMIGAYLTELSPIDAALAAAITMGLCGEYAAGRFAESGRLSDFHAALIDGAFLMNEAMLNGGRFTLYEQT